MKARITEYKDTFHIELEPETVGESSLLMRCNIKCNFKETDVQMHFGKDRQNFIIDIPEYKSKENIDIIRSNGTMY